MGTRWTTIGPLTAVGLALLIVAAPGREDEAGLTWDHEGYSSLLTACREAKESGSRILVGLSGSPH